MKLWTRVNKVVNLLKKFPIKIIGKYKEKSHN